MTDQARIRVLTVDDHPLLREGIAAIINNQPDMLLVSQAPSGVEAIQQFRQHRPDVTLMDLRLPDLSGIDALIAIRAEFTDGDGKSRTEEGLPTSRPRAVAAHRPCARHPGSGFKLRGRPVVLVLYRADWS